MNLLLNVIVLGITAIQAEMGTVGGEALLITHVVNPSSATQIATDHKIKLVDTTDGGPFILYSVSERAKNQIRQRMVADARIIWVEDDLPLGSPEGADQRPEDIRSRVGGTIPAVFDSAAGALYNKDALEQINWRRTPNFDGDRVVRVAVLDTGLSPFQPKLWSNVIATMDATDAGNPYDWPLHIDTNGNGVEDEAVGHGTFVTSIIATVAPYAEIAVAKVADSDGVASAWTVIKGLVFAVQNECELANVSLGAEKRPKALGDVVEWAESFGLTVVAGAGNDDDKRIVYPARYGKVIAVAGVDPFDIKAQFSNYEGHVLQSAPAVLVAGAWWEGGMVGWSGTSFAAPFMTGCLADTARKRKLWWPDDVRTLVEMTGANIDSINPDYEGRLGLRLDWQMLLDQQR